MTQNGWLAVGASIVVLTAGWISNEVIAYARFADCTVLDERAGAVRAWRDMRGAEKTLESARLGGSRYAAAKVGDVGDGAMVRHAEQRLRNAVARLQAAKDACQVAE